MFSVCVDIMGEVWFSFFSYVSYFHASVLYTCFSICISYFPSLLLCIFPVLLVFFLEKPRANYDSIHTHASAELGVWASRVYFRANRQCLKLRGGNPVVQYTAHYYFCLCINMAKIKFNQFLRGGANPG